MICISCHHQHSEKFCPNCGERSVVNKITFGSVTKEGFLAITNMDKGFLFNVKALTLNPRELIINYLNGKRKSIYHPISFLIISIAAYLIVESLLKSPLKTSRADPNSYYLTGRAAGKFVFTYLKYFWILAACWLGLSTKIVFHKYNYAEHIAISAFILGYATLAGLIGYLILRLPLIFSPFLHVAIFLTVYRVFKKDDDKLGSLGLSFVSLFLFVVQLAIVAVAIGVLAVYVNKPAGG